MSKKGTYNGAFFSSFATRIRGTPIRFGVLIGTELDEDGQRDALFAAATPPQPGEDGQPVEMPKDAGALLRSSAGGLPFAEWAAQHLEAVRKMLPGGLEPCGCFVVTAEAAAKDLAPHLVPVLKGIKDPLVLTLDPSAPKPCFWQHSGGAKPALRPAQVKADPHREPLLAWASWALDLVLPRAAGAEADPEVFAAEAERSIAADLRACTAAHSAGAALSAVDFDKDTSISSALPKGCSELQVSFLRNGTALHALPNPEGAPRMRLRCLVVATALVLNRKAELRSTVESLRRSLAASAASRLQLALEEAEGSAGGALQLPYRALCRPADLELPLYFGDYCMPDEEPSAARERLAQLLGVQESSLEPPPAQLDEWGRLSRDFQGTYDAAAQKAEEEANRASAASANKGSSTIAFALVPILVVLVAVLLMFLK